MLIWCALMLNLLLKCQKHNRIKREICSLHLKAPFFLSFGKRFCPLQYKFWLNFSHICQTSYFRDNFFSLRVSPFFKYLYHCRCIILALLLTSHLRTQMVWMSKLEFSFLFLFINGFFPFVFTKVSYVIIRLQDLLTPMFVAFKKCLTENVFLS